MIKEPSTNGTAGDAFIDAIAEKVAERVSEEISSRLENLEGSKELMDAEEAAEFLCLPYESFRNLAPTLKRHKVTARRYVYSRRELLEWVLSKPSW